MNIEGVFIRHQQHDCYRWKEAPVELDQKLLVQGFQLFRTLALEQRKPIKIQPRLVIFNMLNFGFDLVKRVHAVQLSLSLSSHVEGIGGPQWKVV